MMIIGVVAAVVAVIMITGAVLHTTYYKEKAAQIKPYGQLVDVDDGQMHIFSMGRGKKTIVLLPGMGIGLPSADFGPLMRKLSEKVTVICVEYFGVGFSSKTTKSRTCENYVEETRIALKRAGFHAPYVLMPHSISSVYSEYYAAKYPDEVEAIISLDGTSTAYYKEIPAFVKAILPIAKFQQAIGTTSLIGPLTVNKKSLLANGYTKQEIHDMVVYAGFSVNENVLEQMTSSCEYIKQTMDLPYPKNFPYFKVISRQTYETLKTQHKMTPQEYQQKHLERIGEHAKYEILDGTHFIYSNNAKRIAEITDDLLFHVNPND